MNIKLLVSLLAGATFTASLTGCAIAPGPYLDTDRLDQTPSPESVAQANVKYHVRFFSARPIREAHIRLMELGQTAKPPADAITRMHNFAEVKSEGSIIVTVTIEATDQRSGNPVMQALNSAVTGTLKNTCYLQRADGKQLFLDEYIPPGKDGFGARFIFLRMPDEKPFIEANSKEIRFFAQVNSNVKIDRRFKIADMMYHGELEY